MSDLTTKLQNDLTILLAALIWLILSLLPFLLFLHLALFHYDRNGWPHSRYPPTCGYFTSELCGGTAEAFIFLIPAILSFIIFFLPVAYFSASALRNNMSAQ